MVVSLARIQCDERRAEGCYGRRVSIQRREEARAKIARRVVDCAANLADLEVSRRCEALQLMNRPEPGGGCL